MELIKPFVPPPEHFVDIGAVRRIRDGITYARNFGEPVQVISEPGFGKTTALFYLAKELDGKYCQVGQAHKSVSDMYRMLLTVFDIWTHRAFVRDLHEILIMNLRRASYETGPRRLLIIDEIQTLEASSQRELLNIQETCDLALVVGGNGERLAKTKIDHAAWKQVDSRLGMKISLPALDRHDCISIGASFNVEGTDAYDAFVNFGTRTSARFLCRLLREARALAAGGGAGIRRHHIESDPLNDARTVSVPDGYTVDPRQIELYHHARQIERERGISFAEAVELAAGR